MKFLVIFQEALLSFHVLISSYCLPILYIVHHHLYNTPSKMKLSKNPQDLQAQKNIFLIVKLRRENLSLTKLRRPMFFFSIFWGWYTHHVLLSSYCLGILCRRSASHDVDELGIKTYFGIFHIWMLIVCNMDAQKNGQESPRQNFEKGKTPEGTVTLPNYGYCVGIIPLRSTRDLRDFQNRNILILLGHQVISRDFQKMNFRNLLGNNKTSSTPCWASLLCIHFLLSLYCLHY